MFVRVNKSHYQFISFSFTFLLTYLAFYVNNPQKAKVFLEYGQNNFLFWLFSLNWDSQLMSISNLYGCQTTEDYWLVRSLVRCCKERD